MTMPKTESLTDAAQDVLLRRGIDPELADRYGVQSIVPNQRTNQIWIMFPHLVGGGQVHWAARTIGDAKREDRKFHQQPGGQRCLWNQDAIYDETLSRQAPLIITEGHIDALSLLAIGHVSVTSVPDGAPGGAATAQTKPDDDPGAKAKYAYLLPLRDQLRSWTSVILATDADAAGDRLADDLSRVIGLSHCRRMEYPPDCKDANDVLLKHGPEVLTKAVNAARWIKVGGVYDLEQLPSLDLPPAVKCGIGGVDDLWRFRPGELSVLVGIPNHGKSSLANQVGLSLALQHGWVVAWFSPEQHPAIHVHRLLTCYLGKSPKIASEIELAAARKFIRDHVVWIAPERGDEPTVKWWRERIETVARRYNVRLTIGDPWNAMLHDRGLDFREDEYERAQLGMLGETLVESAVHGMVLVHPRKPQADHTKGKVPPPHGYSIAGSSHWINRPDLGATIYRDGDDVSFWCWKARYADGEWYDNGAVGKRSLRFNTLTQRYVALDDGGAL
jgi:twinkle protein